MENIKLCISCNEPKTDELYSKKCIKCYNKERAKYYHVKKRGINDLMFVNNAINHLKCAKFANNEQHKLKINAIICELENIINYY